MAMFGRVASLASVASLLAAWPAQAQVCDRPVDTLAASQDLYCTTLIPVPGLDTLSGHVELGRLPGPFTVMVTPDGRPLYRPIAQVSGLPAPRALGRYTTYVAWAASPTMDPIEKLGPIGNGRTVLAPVDLDPFVFMITAEASDRVTMPTGRVVLRGGSPSTRLMPPDLMQFSIGAVRESAHDSGGMTSSMRSMPGMRDSSAALSAAGSDSVRWDRVPMVPGMAMLPAEMALRPSVAPYLPTTSDLEALPPGRPQRAVQLADGDTLRLTAGLIRRRIQGHDVTLYAFNDQYPGPAIFVRQGSEIVVDFANYLDQPSTIHWHGIRLDAQYDGVPDISQPPVMPGGHFFYHVRFPDPGIYWYHSHVREEIQQPLGLFAPIIVRSPRRDYFKPSNSEVSLMLSDALIGDHGLVPFGRDAATHALMGRFGNVMLTNGEPGYTLTVRRGAVVQFDLTNTSSARTFNLSFPGARMKVVGSDAGNFEHEEWVGSVVIAPAERYMVQVRFDRAGNVPMVSRIRGLDHLFGRFVPLVDTLGTVHVAATVATPDLAASFQRLRTDSAAVASIEPYRRYFDRPVDHTLVLTLETHDLPFVSRQLMQLDSMYFTPVEWSGTMPNMNWASTTKQIRWILRDPASGREGADINWHFRRGDVVKLRLINQRTVLHGMQHPIHIHGQRFLVLAVNGVPNENLVWKDTVLVPAGGAVDILVDLSNPGRWMLHCHIPEHLAAGMMTMLTVE
jgi:FtsP/CotA-like multicopper oxidase with cupredoxin domain